MNSALIIILPVILFTNITVCQVNSNIISEREFNSAKINAVSISDIRATEGNQRKISSLNLGHIEEKRINEGNREPLSYWYKFDGFELSFSSHANSYEHPGLSMFEITNSNWIFNIRGKTVRIGGSINVLGDVKINNNLSRNKSIIYQYCDGCNSFIYINFNKYNKITEIGFVEQT